MCSKVNHHEEDEQEESTHYQQPQFYTPQQSQLYPPQQPQFYPPQQPIYNQLIQNNHNLRVPPQMEQHQFNRQHPPPHKYSPQYASYVGAKPRAQASARIGMGGAF